MVSDQRESTGSGEGDGEQASSRRDLERAEREAEERLRVARLRIRSANGERLTKDEMILVSYHDGLDDLAKWRPLIKAGRLADVLQDLRSHVSGIAIGSTLVRRRLEDRLTALEAISKTVGLRSSPQLRPPARAAVNRPRAHKGKARAAR